MHNDCPGGIVFAPLKSCAGVLSRGGMVLDEIDTCMTSLDFGHSQDSGNHLAGTGDLLTHRFILVPIKWWCFLD